MHTKKNTRGLLPVSFVNDCTAAACLASVDKTLPPVAPELPPTVPSCPSSWLITKVGVGKSRGDAGGPAAAAAVIAAAGLGARAESASSIAWWWW